MVTYSSLKTAKRVASFCEDSATLENIAANENSRGKRFQSGLTLAHYKLFELLENLKRQLAAKLPIGRKFNDYPVREYTISD